MATIRKRPLPSGKTAWQADYVDGAGKRRHKQFTTKREADAFLVHARGELVRGVHIPDATSIMVADAALLWLARGDAEGLERATLDAYGQHVELPIKPLIGCAKLSRISVPSVQAFADKLGETPLGQW
ncbi:hypothetical protein KHC28_01100 [Ancylobacter sonchi]|uniref:hypothetical protein n=1 Tax=Ancylobacter sonchi TaxID=1937790 RepID=UPI001BD6CF59|nr:hypothetical protein [Ancylobacter sonchi]MBS7532262.1 hypothetical protein [Ancylobacter sonchi]